jgi:hypothetical protein
MAALCISEALKLGGMIDEGTAHAWSIRDRSIECIAVQLCANARQTFVCYVRHKASSELIA